MPKNFSYEVEYTFFNQRNKNYEFSPPFKKQFIQVKTSMPKNSVIEIDYTSFNQTNEINVEEDYQFLPFFKKSIRTKTVMPKNFSVSN